MNHCDCEHPELRPEDGKCSEQQIRQCHGDATEHACECGCGCEKE